jgi:hypothetical protein
MMKENVQQNLKITRQNNVKIKIRIFRTKNASNDGRSFEFYCSGFAKSRYADKAIKQEVSIC